MKRIVNFRSFVYSALMVMATAIFCLLALNISWLGFVLLGLLLIVPIVLMIVFRKRIRKFCIVTVILTSVLCIASALNFFIRAFSWNSAEIQTGNYFISGSVEDNYVVDGKRKVILKNLKFDGNEVAGKISVTIKDEGKFFELVPVGDVLNFMGRVTVRKLIDGYVVKANYLRSDIRYTTTANAREIAIEEGKPDFLDAVNVIIKSTLTRCMGSRFGSIAYAMLSGDKNEIASDDKEAFSAAGIAHILAVSGLHIGFLMAVVAFILRKLRVKRLPSLLIETAIMLLYAAFAGFSPSVVRCCVMFEVMSVAMTIGEQNDSLNSLGIAATVILLVNPLMMFEAGFIMSISAVFGIIVLSPVITRGLQKIKIPEKIASFVAASVSAQLGILPSSIFIFETAQLYSVFANILLLPLLSVTFILVFISLIISLIPTFDFFVALAKYPLEWITSAATLCMSFPYANVAVYSSAAIFAAYPAYFTLGGFVNLGNNKKAAIAVKSACIAVPLLIAIVLIIVANV